MDFRVSVSYPAKWSEDWLRIGQISCEHGEGVSHVQMSNFRAVESVNQNGMGG